MMMQILAAASVLSGTMETATRVQTTEEPQATWQDTLTLQEWRYGRSNFSRYYFDYGTGPGSLYFFKYGKSEMSAYYIQYSARANSAYYFRYGNGVGSSYFWRYGREKASQYYWRYGIGCFSEQQWLHRTGAREPCNATSYPPQVFVMLCLAQYITNEACDAWLAAARESWPGLAEFQEAVRLPENERLPGTPGAPG